MTNLSTDSLKYLDGRVSSMLALLRKQDEDSLATLSAKRRFMRIELETSGIDPDRVSQATVDAATQADCPSLARYLDSLRRLALYAGSEERRKWNPTAKPTDLPSQVPVASDWFLQSTYRPEWDEMDFLGRCESIWTENDFTGAGMLFTRIFNYRVKMLAGYEDGIRLVLLLTELGEYVPPLDLGHGAQATVEVLDLVRRKRAYDGQEPNDWYAPIPVPMGKDDWAFTLPELHENPFAELKDALGIAAFDKIMQAQGYRYPEGPFETFVGDDDLSLSYILRDDEQPGARKLLIISNGEFQPGRMMAHVEGIWRVTGGNFKA